MGDNAKAKVPIWSEMVADYERIIDSTKPTNKPTLDADNHNFHRIANGRH